ncbi:MAG: flagellar biosynthetic protein FliO [Proteobacteria bacterium]|nr:flagellar biosynthetic protein FliO [Pseudomonadota bacterium]
MSFVRPAWLKVGISLVLWAGMIVPVVASEVRTLKNIEVISLENSSQLRLEFDGEFSGNPLINFESGSMSLRLDSAQIDSALALLTVPKADSFIKAVRAVQVPNTNIVHLDILPKSSRVVLGHPQINPAGNSLLVILPAKISTNPALSNTEVLKDEIGQRVKADSSFPSTFSKVATVNSSSDQSGELFPMPAQDWVETILTLVFALLFVLLLIYLIAYIYNRFFSGRFSAMQGNIRIRQVSSYHVGPKQKIIVFNMNDRLFACGVTATSINLIAELHDETDQEFLYSAKTDEKTNEINMDHMQADFLKTLEQEDKNINSEETLNESKKEDLSVSMELEGQEKGVFLKPNASDNISLAESNNKNGGSKVKSKMRFSKSADKTGKILHGNKMMQEFANRLSERLKFLKPIK